VFTVLTEVGHNHVGDEVNVFAFMPLRETELQRKYLFYRSFDLILHIVLSLGLFFHDDTVPYCQV
jgi:hypothetical protein